MIKAKPAINLQPTFFEWDLHFKVQIKDVPSAKRLALTKANEEITFNKKHQRTTDTNWIKYSRDFLREAIVGWTGMTYKHLLDICIPITLDPGVKLSDEVEFTEENLVFVLENFRAEFSGFVVNAVDRIAEIHAEQQKKELENL